MWNVLEASYRMSCSEDRKQHRNKVDSGSHESRQPEGKKNDGTLRAVLESLKMRLPNLD